MYKIVCDICHGIIGSSSRAINGEYRDERMNKAMRIRITCKKCLGERIKDIFLESAVLTGEKNGKL